MDVNCRCESSSGTKARGILNSKITRVDADAVLDKSGQKLQVIWRSVRAIDQSPVRVAVKRKSSIIGWEFRRLPRIERPKESAEPLVWLTNARRELPQWPPAVLEEEADV